MASVEHLYITGTIHESHCHNNNTPHLSMEMTSMSLATSRKWMWQALPYTGQQRVAVNNPRTAVLLSSKWLYIRQVNTQNYVITRKLDAGHTTYLSVIYSTPSCCTYSSTSPITGGFMPSTMSPGTLHAAYCKRYECARGFHRLYHTAVLVYSACNLLQVSAWGYITSNEWQSWVHCMPHIK